MLFHTSVFVLFFGVVYAVFLAVKGTRFRVPWLLLCSYVFYGWWNPLYLLLILWSTAVDFAAVTGMAKTRFRKPWVAWSVVNNLGLLGFFKYASFVTQNINLLLARGSVDMSLPEPDILLPVGISFFVFQSMSYTIDFYRGKVEREPNFLHYATFVSLFPQLVAGPIERARNLLPQLKEESRISRQDVAEGLSLFVVGLFKKRALADALATYVDEVFLMPEAYRAPALILAVFAFGWQIYFDFSGYTDMARGVARMLGIRLMLNFRHPYLATGLGDFWERWHISLSTWFKEYVYFPLGGNRKGGFRTYLNMCLTMLVSGLWHGAKWTFVAWGAAHALGRVATRDMEKRSFYRSLPQGLKRIFVFLFVSFCWIFFRAESLSDAWMLIKRIFVSGWEDPRFPILWLILIGLVWIYEALYESSMRTWLERPIVRVGLVLSMLLYLLFFSASGHQAFIYFQF